MLPILKRIITFYTGRHRKSIEVPAADDLAQVDREEERLDRGVPAGAVGQYQSRLIPAKIIQYHEFVIIGYPGDGEWVQAVHE